MPEGTCEIRLSLYASAEEELAHLGAEHGLSTLSSAQVQAAGIELMSRLEKIAYQMDKLNENNWIPKQEGEIPPNHIAFQKTGLFKDILVDLETIGAIKLKKVFTSVSQQPKFKDYLTD